MNPEITLMCVLFGLLVLILVIALFFIHSQQKTIVELKNRYETVYEWLRKEQDQSLQRMNDYHNLKDEYEQFKSVIVSNYNNIDDNIRLKYNLPTVLK